MYCRVSTLDQSNEAQKRELLAYCSSRGWAVTAIYEDQKSGTTTNRPAFQKLMKDAHAKTFDRVVVFKIDRMARSLRDLIVTLQELIDLDVEFVSIRDHIDLTTSAGRLMFNILGAFGQFEAELIRERTVSGLRNAKAKGKRLGRPPTIDAKAVIARRKRGAKIRDIAAYYGVSDSAIKNIIARTRKKGTR